MGWNPWSAPPGGPADQAVYRLAISGDSLRLAGDFSTVGGIAADHVAEWNGENWTAYDLGPSVAVAHLYSLVRDEGGDLFVGGAISGGVRRWNGCAWESVGGGVFMGESSGVVSDMVMHKGDLHITGCSSHVNGPDGNPASAPAQSVARWTGALWEGLDAGDEPIGSTWFEFGVCGDEPNPYRVWICGINGSSATGSASSRAA